MQSAIIPLSVNLDKVMEKLNGTSKEKKIRRKDMENIFDDIVQGESGNGALFRIYFGEQLCTLYVKYSILYCNLILNFDKQTLANFLY